MNNKKDTQPATAQKRLEQLLEQLHQVRCGLRSYYEGEPEQELVFPDYFEVEHCLSTAASALANLIGISALCRVCSST
ncbi:hypothetical protein [Rurimicrobium arvi]|uniref:DUF86 domain-containing protein n=1 Tax=Rurimicrobium arvi TaxID=2049916 RepID=A0ABP8N2N6_9BACT